MSGEINLLRVLLKEQTWTQNHVLQILTYVHYSITLKRDSSKKKDSRELLLFPNTSSQVFAKSAS